MILIANNDVSCNHIIIQSFHHNEDASLALWALLDASSHLYKRVCPSVGPSVHPSVGQSITHELKSCKNAVFDQNYYHYERERILCRVNGLVFSFQTPLKSIIVFFSLAVIKFLRGSRHTSQIKRKKISTESVDGDRFDCWQSDDHSDLPKLRAYKMYVAVVLFCLQ